MNVYFLNPKYLNTEGLDVFLDILKIKRVFNVVPTNERDNGIVKIFHELRECEDFYYDNLEECIKSSAYSFVKPMVERRVVFNSGVEYIYKDLYKNSNSYNPIYNLSYCNDENLLISYIGDEIEEGVEFYRKFIFFVNNILKKYASSYNYGERICFVKFEEKKQQNSYVFFTYFKETSMFHKGGFKSLKRYCPLEANGTMKSPVRSFNFYKIPKEYLEDGWWRKGNIYDPLISYIRNTALILYADKIPNKDFLNFFLNNNYFKTSFEISAYNEYVQECEQNYQVDDTYSESDSWGADSELDEIVNNGGDWVLD